MAGQAHWDAIYQTRASEDLGWYQPPPSTLDLVLRYSTPTDPVIDIGGGDSHMVDELSWVHWYNHQRLHGHCNDIPPVEYEAAYAATQQASPTGVGIQ